MTEAGRRRSRPGRPAQCPKCELLDEELELELELLAKLDADAKLKLLALLDEKLKLKLELLLELELVLQTLGGGLHSGGGAQGVQAGWQP